MIQGTELWGSHYEELLRLVKSYIIDIWELRKSKLYGSGTGLLQHRSQPGRDTARQGKGKLVSWKGRSHALLFMVPLGLPSARPIVQALRLPFEYYYYSIPINIFHNFWRKIVKNPHNYNYF